MTAVRRLVVLGFMLSLVLTGPLGQVARAQQPQQPPPQQPGTPAEPDLFQEALKATGQAPIPPGTSYQPPPTMQPEALKPTANGRQMSDEFYDVFAGVATAFLIPGRALTCVLGSGVAAGVLVISLGSGYRAATRVVEEGCGGRWIVRPDDIRPGRATIDAPIERY